MAKVLDSRKSSSPHYFFGLPFLKGHQRKHFKYWAVNFPRPWVDPPLWSQHLLQSTLFLVMSWEQPNTFLWDPLTRTACSSCRSTMTSRWCERTVVVNFSFHPLKSMSKVGSLINPIAYAHWGRGSPKQPCFLVCSHQLPSSKSLSALSPKVASDTAHICSKQSKDSFQWSATQKHDM